VKSKLIFISILILILTSCNPLNDNNPTENDFTTEDNDTVDVFVEEDEEDDDNLVADRAPVIVAIADETVAENVAITQVNATDTSGGDTDIDGNVITWSCLYDVTINGTLTGTNACTSLTGVSFDTTTGVMDWTPSYAQAGTYEFHITGDEGDLTDDEIFGVTVTNVLLSSAWSFDSGDSANYSFDSTLLNYDGAGLIKLAISDIEDSDDSLAGFGGATLSGIQWDSTNNVLRLNTTINNNELNSDWTPQWANLQGYWQLDNDYTDSKNSYDGTPSGNTSFLSNQKVGTHGITLDGNGDFVDLTDIEMNAWTGLTVMAWVKTSDTNVVARFLSKDQVGIPGNIIFRYAHSRVVFKIYDSASASWRAVDVTLDQTSDEWVHLIATVDTTTNLITLYVNGRDVGTDSFIAGTLDDGDNETLVLGCDSDTAAPDASTCYNGEIDEVALWDIALTKSEVFKIYNKQSPKYAGEMTSRVINGFKSDTSWLSLSWIPTLPFGKVIPNSSCTPEPCSHNQVEESSSYANIYSDTLNADLVGLWNFDTNFDDSSGQDNDGTATSGATLDWIDRKFGNSSASFDGDNDSVDLGSIDPGNPLMLDTGSSTISAWFKQIEGGDEYQRILSKSDGGGGANGYFLAVHPTDKSVIVGVDVNSKFSTAGVYDFNEWTHFVGVITATDYKIYVNGVLNSGGPWGGGGTQTPRLPPNASANMRFGSWNHSTGREFKGKIDEVAIWARELTSTEIKQLYRRGANNIRLQIRSCDDDACSGEDWMGPDGTSSSYFNEKYNTSVQGLPSTGNILTTTPTMTFSNLTAPGANQYFQYKLLMDSDDTNNLCDYGLGATFCSPELSSVSWTPQSFSNQSPTITSSGIGSSFSDITSFTQTLGGNGCADGVTYNLSLDGTNWYYHNSTNWVAANGTVAQSNTVSELNTNAATIDDDIGTSDLYIKAFLTSDGSNDCELDSISVNGSR
jgi:hypothetical protein